MARRKTGNQETVRTRPVSCRLPEPDYLAYQARCADAGMTASEFFRSAILSNTTEIHAKPTHAKPKYASRVDTRRVLFAVNKASEGINQLALRAAADHAAGTLTPEAYEALLYQLELIALLLRATVDAK